MANKFGLKLWDDEKIPLGVDWEKNIQENLNNANIFFFLLSAHSLASEFINNIEFAAALKKNKQSQIDIIPILIRPCAWQVHDIQRFQILPKNGKPLEDIEFWKDKDKVFIKLDDDKKLNDKLEKTLNELRGEAYGLEQSIDDKKLDSEYFTDALELGSRIFKFSKTLSFIFVGILLDSYPPHWLG